MMSATMSTLYPDPLQQRRMDELSQELAVLREIRRNPSARNKLRVVIKPVVRRTVENYCLPASDLSEKLEEVAMTFFDDALDRYLVRHTGGTRTGGREPYAFSTSFIPIVRRSIRTYFGVAEHPLPGIRPFDE